MEELTELTSRLKDGTKLISETVQAQNINLDAIQIHASKNVEELNRQRKAMTVREKSMSSSLWTTISTLVFVFSLFAGTYAIIRIFPKA
jgi:hypothetical protein